MEICVDPKSLEGFWWWACYLTNGKHQAFYASFLVVIALLAVVAPTALFFGFLGAIAKRSLIMPIRMIGSAYTNMVRGIPEIIFFMFVPIAIDQGLEFIRHRILCPASTGSVYQGNEFIVCDAAKLPLSNAAVWVHDVYGFFLAAFAFSIVFGSFAANTLFGAMQAVPKNQIETGAAFGLTDRQIFNRIIRPQMWVYALPGLSNIWMVLVKATPLLFLLGVEDIVYWAREIGSSKTQIFSYPHPDWRLWYFLALLVFYLFCTWASDKYFNRLSQKYNFDKKDIPIKRTEKTRDASRQGSAYS